MYHFKFIISLMQDVGSQVTNRQTNPDSVFIEPVGKVLILPSHLSLGLPSGLFPSGFPTKTLYMPLLFSMHATCPVHLILLDFITRIIEGEEYKSLSPSI
jgi:hypothetical protein